MSDGETVDLVVRGLTRNTVKHLAGKNTLYWQRHPITSAARELVAEWEREERESTKYTDDDGRWVDLLKDRQGRWRILVDDKGGREFCYVSLDGLGRALNAARAKDGLPRLVEEGEKRGARDHTAEAEAWVQRTAQKTDEWVARQRSTYARAEEPCGSESADVRVRAFQKVPQEIQAKAMEAATAEIAAEASDATSYTDDQGRRLWLERGDGGVAIAAPDGDPLVPHPALLAAVNAARERDGLARLVEESGDGACSDPTCSYRAEMDGLSAACKGMGCQIDGGMCVYEETEDDEERAAILGAAPASTASATTRVVMPGPDHSPEPSPGAVEHVKRWAAANYGMLISTYDAGALLSGLPGVVSAEELRLACVERDAAKRAASFATARIADAREEASREQRERAERAEAEAGRCRDLYEQAAAERSAWRMRLTESELAAATKDKP